MITDLINSRPQWRPRLMGKPYRVLLQSIDSGRDDVRDALGDNVFDVLDGYVGRASVDKACAEELGYLQQWLQRERPLMLRVAHGIDQHTYEEAVRVWRHFTSGLSIDSPRVDCDRLALVDQSSHIERAALLRAFNKEIGVERRHVCRMLSAQRELAHWDGPGSATMSARRARMYQI